MNFSIPNLQQNVVLAPYATFKIGGPAEYFVIVKSKEELFYAVHAAQKARIKLWLLGAGSNVLISDKGVQGLVIKCDLKEIFFDTEHLQITAEAGASMQSVIVHTLEQGLGGLEFAVGIPASVGGAVWANLGARGCEIKDLVQKVLVLDIDGRQANLTNAECEFSYRNSIFKKKKLIIVAATFQLTKKNPKEISATLRVLYKKRRESQDIAAKSAGCIFKNPLEQASKSAGELIDSLGLKGFSIGSARISERHANFIINQGGATAEEVVMLISLIKQKVRDNFGIQLMEEIEYVGF